MVKRTSEAEAQKSTLPAGRATTKRSRLSTADDDDNPTLQNREIHDAATSRSRGLSACEKCRSRKTRCDNIRPSCGYCTAHRIACVYPEDALTASWSETGAQILEAIDNLTAIVTRQQRQFPSFSNRCDHGKIPESFQLASSPQSTGRNTRTSLDETRHGAPNVDSSLSIGSSKKLIRPQGMESILEWQILAPYRISSCLFASDTPSILPNESLPIMSLEELTRLESKYVDGVHLKNPILDLSELHQIIVSISETGLDWSTRSCLVTLVCAIGAMTQGFQNQTTSSNIRPPSANLKSPTNTESQPELGRKFWNTAAKRLGFVIGQNNVQAVQCLCLAGIWHMHELQPLEAWKYFNLAGAAWHSVSLTDDPSGRHALKITGSTSLTIMQSLFFTIWKSEFELAREIAIPIPILDNVDFPHAFPLPPDLNSRNQDLEAADNENAWYYYLTDIAARHMTNRLLRLHIWEISASTEENIQRMIDQADTLELQLQEWYSALPPTCQFEIPTGFSLEPHPNDWVHILRYRYIGYRELVGRPFVRLCVEAPLDNIGHELRARIIKFASQSLQYCMFRLSQVETYIHQGTWFSLRSTGSSSLVLCAVKLAKRYSWLQGASILELPNGWRAMIQKALDTLKPLWESGRGSASEIHAVIQSVFNEASRD